jgi:RimJ/RimL family protein N-acetyltransferase
MSETVVPVLLTKRLKLRALQEADAAGLHTAYSDPVAMRFWDSPPSNDVAETLVSIRRSRSADAQYHAAFAIELQHSGQFVGMVNYHDRRPWARRLVLGWILARPFWQQGLMQEAAQALLGHCFGELNTHRVEAEIEPENTASIRLAERLGFQREGLLRERMFVAGEPRSVLMYALLQPDWRGAE